MSVYVCTYLPTKADLFAWTFSCNFTYIRRGVAPTIFCDLYVEKWIAAMVMAMSSAGQ